MHERRRWLWNIGERPALRKPDKLTNHTDFSLGKLRVCPKSQPLLEMWSTFLAPQLEH